MDGRFGQERKNLSVAKGYLVMLAAKSGPIQTLSQRLRRLWSGDADTPATSSDAPAVIVHDPAAQGPRDLDDPFFDRDVQARAADLIASVHHTEKK
jgi:hypothetical protein